MKQHVQNIGKEAVYFQERGMGIHVKIQDIRQAFGRIDYEVQATFGGGTKWVMADNVKLNPEQWI